MHTEHTHEAVGLIAGAPRLIPRPSLVHSPRWRTRACFPRLLGRDAQRIASRDKITGTIAATYGAAQAMAAVSNGLKPAVTRDRGVVSVRVHTGKLVERWAAKEAAHVGRRSPFQIKREVYQKWSPYNQSKILQKLDVVPNDRLVKAADLTCMHPVQKFL